MTDSIKGARALIEELQQNWEAFKAIGAGQPNSGGGIQIILEEIVSKQLYSKETHFLLELIQNADDNHYIGVYPSLDFTLRKDSLRIDCNEVGFTDSNVRALCSFGQSTKSKSAQHIGEKGIGFKSVFKVAATIYIHSRHFSFKFDGKQDLGNVTPIWCEFPAPVRHGHTSFLLELSKDCDKTMIAQELKTLDRTMLLFLRQLKQINVVIDGEDGDIWQDTLSREDLKDRNNHLTRLWKNNTPSDYLIVRHKVENLPEMKQRPGCSSSEIVLGFPILNVAEKPKRTQMVHAFLPIRDYGFKFLLQGDFILTANRQDIDDNAWNRTIRDGITDAFAIAVGCFNDFSGFQQYQWPYYLPGENISDFFKPVINEIHLKLAHQPLLEASNGTLFPASSLYYVPRIGFVDSYAKPFTLFSKTASKYLSSKYPDDMENTWTLLGLEILNPVDFLYDLASLIATDSKAFQNKGLGWHSQLAKTLSILFQYSELQPLIQDLPVVPLVNGTWKSARQGPLYLPASFRVPSGIDMKVVHRKAALSASRRSFFMHLGILPAPDKLTVCRLIIEKHMNRRFDPFTVTTSQLISHVAFLFMADFRPSKSLNLWFVTTKNGRVRSSEAYVRDGGRPVVFIPGSNGKFTGPSDIARRAMNQLEEEYPFVHRSYRLFMPDSVSWLQNTFGIATLPRAYTGNIYDFGSLRLSSEFKFLFRKCHSRDVLELLKTHWPTTYWNEMISKQGVVDDLKNTEVACYGGTNGGVVSIPLHKTFLPKIDPMVDRWFKIPRLIINDPSDWAWGMLRSFGVTVERNLKYYIDCLKSPHEDSIPKSVVAHIYQYISAFYAAGDRKTHELIKEAFVSNRLIYTEYDSSRSRSSDKARWINRKTCLDEELDILSEYPESTILFEALLPSSTRTLNNLVKDAITLPSDAELSVRLDAFKEISRTVKDRKTKAVKSAFEVFQRWKTVFPIISNWGEKEYDDLAPLNPAFPPWFIADRHHLRDSFIGCVKLLAFLPEDMEQIEEFLRVLELEPRRLSKIVKTKSAPSGKFKVNKRWTISLRQKAPFIAALLPKSIHDRYNSVKQLLGLVVNMSIRIAQTYEFVYGSRTFTGHEGEGQVAFSVKSDRLQIYMTRDNIMSPQPPPELINGLIELYSITNPVHRNLIAFALNEESQERTWNTFRREGIYVSDNPLGIESNSFSALSRDEFLDTTLPDDEDNFSDTSDSFSSNFQRIPAVFRDNLSDCEDRRLPLQTFRWSERILYRNLATDATADYSMELRREPAHTQLLAEIMTSNLFRHHLGNFFDPEQHWTSPLRIKAGYTVFPHTLSTHASFTITDWHAIGTCTEFLIKHGCLDADVGAWRFKDPIYHFDIAITAGDSSTDFSWMTPQLERMRNFRLDNQWRPTKIGQPRNMHVHVLVRISNAFTSPKFDFYVDPWRLFVSHKMLLVQDWALSAKIIDTACITASEVPMSPHPSSSLIADVVVEQPNQMAIASPLINDSDHIHELQRDNSSQVRSLLHPRRAPVVVGSYHRSCRSYETNQSLALNRVTESSIKPLSIEFLPSTPHFTSNYKYKTLEKGVIRLLMLHPGGKDSPLRAAVFHSPLLLTSSFQAISYVWGSSGMSHSLWTSEGIINITESLHGVLRCLRHEKQALILWADAICIDQENESEKIEQIRLLPEVFQRATCVIANLGEDGDGDNVLETLMQIRVKEAMAKVAEEWPKDLKPIPDSWKGRRIPPEDDPIWDQIGGFFERSWFQRAWIIQEVVVAISVRVTYGRWMVDWNDLVAALEVINRESQVSSPDTPLSLASSKWSRFMTLVGLREREAEHDRRPLLELLEEFRDAKSTKEHDRIFCLLGLAIDGNNKDFVLDYTLRFSDLMRKYAWAFVRQGKVMELLHRARGVSEIDPLATEIPSWVPDWTIPKRQSLRSLAVRGMPCSASSHSSPRLQSDCVTDGSELRLYGSVVDRLEVVSKTSNTAEERLSYLQETENMIKSVIPRQNDDLIWKSPIAGVSISRLPGADLKSSYASLKAYLVLERNQSRAKAQIPSTKLSEASQELDASCVAQAQAYLLSLQDLDGWKFAITKKNRIGVVPAAAMKGDLVSIIDGGVLPFLLRKAEGIDCVYDLVGECYMNGLMSGEAEEVRAVRGIITLR